MNKYTLYEQIYTIWTNIHYMNKYTLYEQIYTIWTNIQSPDEKLGLIEFQFCFLRCPTYDLINFFSIPTRFKYSHPGLNISTEVEIFEPGRNI